MNTNNRDDLLRSIARLERELSELEEATFQATKKLNKLRSLLRDLDQQRESCSDSQITKFSSADVKISLFASLFRGRNDVFAKMWESKTTGRKGYSPACEFEWQPGICTKPHKKCTNCKFVPLTHDILRGHLTGDHVIGIYPLLKDETCWFLAVDFDKSDWQNDVSAFRKVCHLYKVPAVLEKSRSGNGGHVWIFFETPVPAYLARQMGTFLITETMSRHHSLSMDSYDRLFPNNDLGVIVAPPGSGKTVIAIALIAMRQRSTLILVHRKPLLRQWQEKLTQFLELSSEEIGTIRGGEKTKTGRIDVAMLQSLIRKGEVDPVIGEYGQIIVDECHHIPAFSFERVLKNARSRFVVGLTATPVRRDGHHPIIHMQCGPVRFQLRAKDSKAMQNIDRRLICRPTGITTDEKSNMSYQDVLQFLVNDDTRNRVICEDVLNAVKLGRCPLVLTERRKHLQILHSILQSQVKNLIVLHGGKSDKERSELQQKLSVCIDAGGLVILATGSYIGEGFDCPPLDVLFLTMPVSFKGKLEQYAGRILRDYAGKKEVVIYDYVDQQIPVLQRMFRKRLSAYQSLGFETHSLPPKKYGLVKAGNQQLDLKGVIER